MFGLRKMIAFIDNFWLMEQVNHELEDPLETQCEMCS